MAEQATKKQRLSLKLKKRGPEQMVKEPESLAVVIEDSEEEMDQDGGQHEETGNSTIDEFDRALWRHCRFVALMTARILNETPEKQDICYLLSILTALVGRTGKITREPDWIKYWDFDAASLKKINTMILTLNNKYTVDAEMWTTSHIQTIGLFKELIKLVPTNQSETNWLIVCLLESGLTEYPFENVAITPDEVWLNKEHFYNTIKQIYVDQVITEIDWF
jgi:hypothetical protein